MIASEADESAGSEARDLGDERRPWCKSGADRREAARQTAGGAASREGSHVDTPRGVSLGELGEPSLELVDGVRIRALLRPEHTRGVDERRRDVAGDDDVRAAEVEVERLERAEAAVDGRRPADGHDQSCRAPSSSAARIS